MKPHPLSYIVLIPLAAFLILWNSCSAPYQAKGKSSAGIQPGQDSTTYELVIIDPDFDLWYLMKFSPALDRSEETYQFMNRQGVLKWNACYSRGMYPDVVASYIDYRPEIRYGIELNRRLYWYFRFIEEKYQIPLLR